MADKNPTAADIAIAEKEKRDARAAQLKADRDATREKRAGETKGDAFKRIATGRTNAVIGALATLQGVFNTDNYEYTPEQANMVLSAIDNAVSKLRTASTGVKAGNAGFSL